jgi:hypothetical protein
MLIKEMEKRITERKINKHIYICLAPLPLELKAMIVECYNKSLDTQDRNKWMKCCHASGENVPKPKEIRSILKNAKNEFILK